MSHPMDDYNGWANRETWALGLHLSNDWGLYHTCLDMVAHLPRTREGAHQGGDLFQEWFTERYDDMLEAATDAGVPKWITMAVSDLNTLGRIDWVEIAESFMED